MTGGVYIAANGAMEMASRQLQVGHAIDAKPTKRNNGMGNKYHEENAS
ncbi:hypothetical protein LCGC14_2691710 [marine sediment metagenome]|uniref:Uncharacterized protein n=1 Tax=marine sediment metagenome TaxID=412755 RepID=A0A0F9CA49_9ZZZZ